MAFGSSVGLRRACVSAARVRQRRLDGESSRDEHDRRHERKNGDAGAEDQARDAVYVSIRAELREHATGEEKRERQQPRHLSHRH